MQTIELNVNEAGIALLALNKPDKLNVLCKTLITEFRQCLHDLRKQDSVRALIITGRGRGFCAGADLSAAGSEGEHSRSPGETVANSMQEYFNPMMRELYEFPKPVLSAINGIAAGGGAGLALAVDLPLAADTAKLKIVQVPQLGIVADLGANWLLPRISGRVRALGACLLGDTLDAQTLLDWGLVWQCCPADDLLGRAHELAEQLAAAPAETVLSTRRLVDSATDLRYEQMLEEERICQRKLCDLPQFSQVVASYQ